MVGELYKITNLVNQKVYIGKTYIGYLNRWERHIKDYKSKLDIDTKFARAVRKYGREAFKVELLLKVESGDLEQLEIEYIKKYDSYHNGYNSTLGGDGYCQINLDEDEVVKLYDAGYSVNYIALEFGTKTTRSISKILKGHGRAVSGQTVERVKQFNKAGELINEFESKRQAWNWLQENYKSDIRRCTAYYYIKKASETCGIAFGYRWKQESTDIVHTGCGTKHVYFCDVYDDCGLLMKHATLAKASRYVLENNLSESRLESTVRAAIVGHNCDWVYGLYFVVYREEK